MRGVILRAAMAFAVAGAGMPVSGAMAQDEMPTADEMEQSLPAYFGKGYNITIHNWREGTGKNRWDMVRRVSAATYVRHCFTRLETPRILSKTTTDPAKIYGIDFTKVRAVDWDGGYKIILRADHMANDEYGEMVFHSSEDAEMLAAVLEFIAEDCGGIG